MRSADLTCHSHSLFPEETHAFRRPHMPLSLTLHVFVVCNRSSRVDCSASIRLSLTLHVFVVCNNGECIDDDGWRFPLTHSSRLRRLQRPAWIRGRRALHCSHSPFTSSSFATWHWGRVHASPRASLTHSSRLRRLQPLSAAAAVAGLEPSHSLFTSSSFATPAFSAQASWRGGLSLTLHVFVVCNHALRAFRGSGARSLSLTLHVFVVCNTASRSG